MAVATYLCFSWTPTPLDIVIDGYWNSVNCDTIFHWETGTPIGLISIQEGGGRLKWINDERPDWVTDEKLRELPAKYWLDKEGVEHLIKRD